MIMILQTERLLLRPWRESDAPALFKYAQNPNVGPIAGWPPHQSEDESREIIRSVLSESGTFAVVLKATNEAIGSIGIMPLRSATRTLSLAEGECEMGYWIGEPFWGKGLIPEAVEEVLRYAFEDLAMKVVWCGYYDGNVKSLRVQEKSGFTYSHTEEQRPVPLLGEVRTEHFTKLTLEEWKKRRKK